MKKIVVGVLLGFCILLGLTVFIQRKKIWNLDECDCDCHDDECDCGCECDCETEEAEVKKEEAVRPDPTVDPEI